MSDDTLIGKARERLAEATASVLDVEPRLGDGVRAWLGVLNEALGKGSSPGRVDQVGTVVHVADGVAIIAGLPEARFNELLRFPGGVRGLAFNLDPESIGCVILGDDTSLSAGDPVRLTGQVAVVPVGEALLGRVVDALGRPLDGEGAVECEHVSPVERESAPILERAPVVRQLVTGTTAIDALIPIGRGQRELIVGDRATGKTSLAVDAMISQRDTDIICIYVAIGQKVSTVKRVTESLRKNGSLRRTIIVSADADDSPGLQYIAPYAATTMGEHFMEQGKDVLVVYDDLTRHARSYREVSLLLRRPPGREAYPGDIFFIHSRLLERATHLGEKAGGGSLTAIPIVETQAKNISAYIPTNLISITDGQIFLDPDLFYKGVKPAIHVGKSVSRVGGKTQLPAIRAAAKQLRLEYAQFAELEIFTRFGATVEKETQQKIDRGRRIRELLKQSRLDPFRAPDEVMLLLAVSRGFIDRVPVERVTAFVKALRGRTNPDVEAISARIESGAELTDDEWEALAKVVESVADDFALEKAVASEPVAPEPAERERDAEPPAA
ncbi:MAG: F0F1 ATP synthase subunit alpha [Planctomycetota bacterium]|jgi:F-type H+-transporting ATPase subunit alpha